LGLKYAKSEGNRDMALMDRFRRVVQILEFHTQKRELKKETESWEDDFIPT
jgi:hypothetical protein